MWLAATPSSTCGWLRGLRAPAPPVGPPPPVPGTAGSRSPSAGSPARTLAAAVVAGCLHCPSPPLWFSHHTYHMGAAAKRGRNNQVHIKEQQGGRIVHRASGQNIPRSYQGGGGTKEQTVLCRSVGGTARQRRSQGYRRGRAEGRGSSRWLRTAAARQVGFLGYMTETTGPRRCPAAAACVQAGWGLGQRGGRRRRRGECAVVIKLRLTGPACR